MSTSLDSIKLKSDLSDQPLDVPESLTQQLRGFRDRVWTTKIAEAVLLGIVGLVLAFLTVYVCDRFVDTPRQVRVILFFAAMALWSVVPRAVYRWIWKHRQLEQLARLLRVREPIVGDQLLSVIELANNPREQARSRTLCAAAISQVAVAAKSRDFKLAAPQTSLRSLGGLLAVGGAATMGLAVLFPEASSNAWSRFAAPWKDTPRYTFTSIEPLATKRIVAHGEVTTLIVRLDQQSKSRPGNASLQIDSLPVLDASIEGREYRFELPPQSNPVSLSLSVGDYSQEMQLEPKMRPELVGSTAKVKLPEYLERPEAYEQDVRSGTLSVVKGSSAQVTATASRALSAATVNGQNAPVQQAVFMTEMVSADTDSQSLELWWKDHDDLAGREPFKLSINPVVDEQPTILSQDLPRQAVVLDSEQLNFQALAADDFGIKRIGLSWKGLDDRLTTSPEVGEKVLSSGGPIQTSMQAPATFSAHALGIAPQPIEVRLWAEDYLPQRERVYGPPHVLFVLTAEEHAIWIMNQMSKWHRAALDVRDKELQLHEENKRLRAMSKEELADENLRNELRRQAAAENSNARRLSSLAGMGENLLRQASRNPEIGVGHLDRWAEMLQILNDIGTNRMPSVSDLLDKASEQKQLARGGAGKSTKPSGPQAGENRGTPGAGSKPAEDEKIAAAPKLPSISDMESSQQPAEGELGEAKKKKYNGSRLTLPKTTLAGPAKKSDGAKPDDEPTEDDEPVDQAIDEQADLLAEFERIADELNTVLANLEGSTLVKRLKAASREQNQVAQKITSRIDAVFGTTTRLAEDDREMLAQLTEVEEKSRQQISYIMDDMQSYFERRRMNQFKVVLDDMKEAQVLEALRTLGEDIPKEQGLSIAQAEYWSDSLDRWGDDLVDPACSGQCPGCKTSDALPPSFILEALRILESEVNLREETRVAEQARSAVAVDAHAKEATRLSDVQVELRKRTDALITAIEDLPDGAARFPKEINLLTAVSRVMSDAKNILASGDTGSAAIAAETEAIELLLQCKRINPNAGGGGGSTPGGGGTGTTQDSALALLGSGLNQNERRQAREVTQVTGETGRQLPEEYRAGLDEYFNRLEQGL